MHPFKKTKPSVLSISFPTHAGHMIRISSKSSTVRQPVRRAAKILQRRPVGQRMPAGMAGHSKNTRLPCHSPLICFYFMITAIQIIRPRRYLRYRTIRKIFKVARIFFHKAPESFAMFIQPSPAWMIFQRHLIHWAKCKSRLNSFPAVHKVFPFHAKQLVLSNGASRFSITFSHSAYRLT